MSSHAVHHLIRIGSRWQSPDSWALSLHPGHDTSGLMRHWHRESSISGSAPARSALVADRQCQGSVMEFGDIRFPNASLVIKNAEQFFSHEIIKGEFNTHCICTNFYSISVFTQLKLFFPTQTVCRGLRNG